MSMVCQECQVEYEQRLQCPTCNARLKFKPGKDIDGAASKKVHILQTPWGRVLLGILLSQGLYLGLRKLFTAGLLALDEPGILITPFGVVAMQVLQLVGLMVGGILSGAGQKRWYILGGVMGAWNGVLSILFPVLFQGNAAQTTIVVICGLPLLHTLFGIAAGYWGATIWKPLAPAEEPKAALYFEKEIVQGGRKDPATFAGPVAWLRVILGAVFAVCGTLFAKKILDNITEFSNGKLTADSYLHAELILWEIKAISILIGSAIAGSATINSLKQGFVVGITVGAITLGGALGGQQLPLDQAILIVGCALALGILGGWFGGHLFPPYVGHGRPKDMGPAAY